MIPHSKFRSTSAYASRTRRAAVAIERATFVIFTVSERRFAVPVESVERVLRGSDQGLALSSGVATVQYRGLAVPIVDLAAHLTAHLASQLASQLASHHALADGSSPAVEPHDPTPGHSTSSTAARLLIVSLPTGWVAVAVDAVHEIATIDAAIITLAGHAPAETAQPLVPGALLPGVRGMFVRQEQQTLVLDIGRALGFRFS